MTQHEQLPHSCRPSLVTLSAELPYSQAGLPSSCWTPTRVSHCSTAHPLPNRWAHIATLQQALPLTTSMGCVWLSCSLRPAQLHRAVRRVAAKIHSKHLASLAGMPSVLLPHKGQESAGTFRVGAVGPLVSSLAQDRAWLPWGQKLTSDHCTDTVSSAGCQRLAKSVCGPACPEATHTLSGLAARPGRCLLAIPAGGAINHMYLPELFMYA